MVATVLRDAVTTTEKGSWLPVSRALSLQVSLRMPGASFPCMALFTVLLVCALLRSLGWSCMMLHWGSCLGPAELQAPPTPCALHPLFPCAPQHAKVQRSGGNRRLQLAGRDGDSGDEGEGRGGGGGGGGGGKSRMGKGVGGRTVKTRRAGRR